MTRKELAALVLELLEHLEYTGWGDRWEREVSEDLRRSVERVQKRIERIAEGKE